MNKRLIPMSSKSFREVLTARQQLVHRRAIYQELVDHLGKFLDSDIGAAKLGIRTEGDDLVVPQDYVEEERDNLLAQVAEIEKSISTIDTSTVADEKSKQTTTQARKKTNGKTGKKGKGQSTT
jgi:hypothetical protein